MKKCAYCKEDMLDDATVCPHCRKQAINPMAIWIMLGIFLFIAAIFILPQFFQGTKQRPKAPQTSDILGAPIKTYIGSISAGSDGIYIVNVPEAKDKSLTPTRIVNVFWLNPYSNEWDQIGTSSPKGMPYMMVNYDTGTVDLMYMPVGSAWEILVFSTRR